MRPFINSSSHLSRHAFNLTSSHFPTVSLVTVSFPAIRYSFLNRSFRPYTLISLSVLPLGHAFIHSFIHLSTYSFIHPPSQTTTFINVSSYTNTHRFIHSLTQSNTLPFIFPLTQIHTNVFTSSLTQPHIHLSSHSNTH